MDLLFPDRHADFQLLPLGLFPFPEARADENVDFDQEGGFYGKRF